ncbi:MAG: WYL domain-containing protein [Spirochaetaceae bacterium]|nr:WYL domain-containing protein [Spirochaetaceae bacterium]HPG26539.1 WYL domain-containing protein [Myxococcota bacterium]
MSADDSRFSRLEELLELAIDLQGSFAGVSLDDVMTRFGVSRRTATRMLGSVRRAVGEALFESETGDDGRKRWRLSRPATNGLFRVGAAELAALAEARDLAEREGNARLARELEGLIHKLRALSPPDWLVHVDPDLEAIVEAQGVAFRAGPRPRVDDALLEQLRHAILTGRRVHLRHRKIAGGRAAWQTVGPLGFLYGSRHYLVAWSERRRQVVLFRLSRIDRVETLESTFDAPADFDLDAFARQSFGVFQEEPIDVVWRFTPRVAAEAREHVFHPDQTLEDESDGSLVVRFRAGGLREMAWHLFTWGGDVEVVEPAALRRELSSGIEAGMRALGRGGRGARTVAAKRRVSRSGS